MSKPSSASASCPIGPLGPGVQTPSLRQQMVEGRSAPEGYDRRSCPGSSNRLLKGDPQLTIARNRSRRWKSSSRGSDGDQRCVELRASDVRTASCAKSERSLQKPRPGSLGRPARSRQGLRVRESQSGHVSRRHDVPAAGGLDQRVLRVAWPSSIGPRRQRCGAARAHSRDPSHLRGRPTARHESMPS